MPAQTNTQRITFAQVAIGQRFFDLISAEYFVKTTDELAKMVSGDFAGSLPDEFEPDDPVRIGN